MAISFYDINKVIDNFGPDEKDPVEVAAYNKILKARKNAEDVPNGKNFREILFAGNLGNDNDVWRLMHKMFPNDTKDILQMRFGEAFNWKPEQVATLMGFSKPIDIVRTTTTDSIPAWKLGRGDTPEEIKRSLKNEYYGILDAKNLDRLYNWLEAYDAQYRNQKEYTGGATNATRTLFAPRTQESLLRHGDYKKRDLIGDIGENILQLFGWAPGRVVARGARGLGWTNKFARAAEPVVSSAFVPTTMNVYDAAAYTPRTNPNRSDFSPVKTMKETAINLATIPAVSSQMSAYGKAAGLSGPSKREVMASLSGDPYVEAQHAIADLGKSAPVKSGKSPTQLGIETEIVKAVRAGEKNAEKIGKEQRKKWEDWMAYESPKEVLENYLEDVRSINQLPEPYRTTAFKEFEANREVVYPTELLTPEQKNKYGVSESGQLGIIGSKSGLNKSHNVPTTLDPSRSARNMKIKAKMGHTDKRYNRESDFDKVVSAAQADPYVSANISKNDPKLIAKLSVASLVGNKLGKGEYASRVGLDKNAGEDFIHGISEDVKAYLNDRAMTKMWDLGFEPNNKENDDDPLVKAWKIYTRKEK